jgi:SAM-dependent methyltransferase
MKDVEKLVNNLYVKGEYIHNTPLLHEESSPWKLSKIIPLVRSLFQHGYGKAEVNILDIGGGAGVILKELSTYIKTNFQTKVNKYVLDLSPQMLEAQKKKNTDIIRALNEDIRHTSIGDKEIDLVLLIDVLEHIPEPTQALEEIRRIADYLILKVPLEDSIFHGTWNFLNRGKPRRYDRDVYGHINLYNLRRLISQIKEHAGVILDYHLSLTINRPDAQHAPTKAKIGSQLKDSLALPVYLLSPRLCSAVFGASAFILVQCDRNLAVVDKKDQVFTNVMMNQSLEQFS